MLAISFEYDLDGLPVTIFATCKSITDAEQIDGLTITFVGEDDVRLHIPFNKDLFDDIEDEAIFHLGNAYYSPELNFNRAH